MAKVNRAKLYAQVDHLAKLVEQGYIQVVLATCNKPGPKRGILLALVYKKLAGQGSKNASWFLKYAVDRICQD